MTRKHYSAALKAQVAIEVIHGEKTLSQLGLPTYLWTGAPQNNGTDSRFAATC